MPRDSPPLLPNQKKRLGEIHLKALERESTARMAVLIVMIAYLSVVFINALSLAAVFWLNVARQSAVVPWTTLISLGLSSGGMGAGSLVFMVPLRYLFASGD